MERHFPNLAGTGYAITSKQAGPLQLARLGSR